jgi:ureidoacrylate peracid hydrolase
MDDGTTTPPATAVWSKYALVVVDCQRDFWDDDVAVTSPDMPQRLTDLLTFSRRSGLRVIHVRARFQPDGSNWMARYRLRGSIPCIDGTSGADVVPWAAEVPGETVITKHSFDAFLGTNLAAELRASGVEFVLIAGLVTSTCVLFTAASATQLGFLVAVVTDCCSDRVRAHVDTLDNYRFVFDVVQSEEISMRRTQWNADLDGVRTSSSTRPTDRDRS